MEKIELKNIKEIQKNPSEKGYLIGFQNGQTILMHKRRTIPALLTLIKHKYCRSNLYYKKSLTRYNIDYPLRSAP